MIQMFLCHRIIEIPPPPPIQQLTIGLAAALLVIAWRRHRKFSWLPSQNCHRCGYPKGSSAHCSECGSPARSA